MADRFGRGFGQTFGPAFQQSFAGIQRRIQSEREQRLKIQQESEQAKGLGEVLQQLNIPGSDIIGKALQEQKITPSQSASLIGAMQKGNMSLIDAFLIKELGLEDIAAQTRGFVPGEGARAPVETRRQLVALPDTRQPFESKIDAATGLLGGRKTRLEERTEEAIQEVRRRPRFEIESITRGGVKLKPIQTEEQKEAALQNKLNEIQATGNLETLKQVRTQKEKDIAKTEQDFINASLKIDSTFDSWLDTVNRTFELTGGAQPGILGGSITKVLGETKANEFYEGYRGGLVEYAAAIGRIAMPGSRATRLIRLFKATAPTSFSSIPSAIQNSADSFRNALSVDMSRSPEAYVPGYNALSRPEKLEANKELTRMLQGFEKTFKEGLYKRAFAKNPELVPDEIRVRLEQEEGSRTQTILSNPDEFERID